MKEKNIFEYNDFFDFLKNEVEKNSLSEKGRKKKLSEFINLHPTSLSQVFSRKRLFTDEQVYLLCNFMHLSEMEGQYILILNQIENSFNEEYKMSLKKRAKEICKKSFDLSSRLDKGNEINDEDKTMFYSAWYYSCVWAYISLDGGKTFEEIHQRFNISEQKLHEALSLLQRIGFSKCENKRYYHQVGSMHINKDSVFLKQHYCNWRIMALNKFDQLSDEDLNYTAPFSLSKKDFYRIREEMIKLIKTLSDTVSQTTPEEVYCFNLDLFKI